MTRWTKLVPQHYRTQEMLRQTGPHTMPRNIDAAGRTAPCPLGQMDEARADLWQRAAQ